MTRFEHSDDDEMQVNLEGITLGDGKYEKFSQFMTDVRKLQKLVECNYTVSVIKEKVKKTKKKPKVRRERPYEMRKGLKDAELDLAELTKR